VAFPIGMYAAASLQFATVFELPFVRPAADVTFWLSLCVWALSVIGMGIHAANGARLLFDLTEKLC
jgi:tellurite resistance protein TehA-like permease